MHGVLVLDKAPGITSRTAVNRVRRLLGAERAGHAGTLDPLATGVLVVCMDRATLLSRYLAAGMKEYEVEVLLGVETDTYDADGEVTSRGGAAGIGFDDVRSELQRLTGSIEQMPPMYSAVKHLGKPLYRYARDGVEVTPRSRTVLVESAEVLSLEGREGLAAVGLRFTCGPGTFVRSLVSDLGRSLGCGATVNALRRTRSGPFSIEGAHPEEELEGAAPEGLLLSMEEATDHMASLRVSGEDERSVRYGKPLIAGSVPGGALDGPCRVLGAEGGLLALYGPPRGDDAEEIAGRALRVVRPAGSGEGTDEGTR